MGRLSPSTVAPDLHLHGIGRVGTPDAVGVEIKSEEPLVIGGKATLSLSSPADVDKVLSFHSVPDPTLSNRQNQNLNDRHDFYFEFEQKGTVFKSNPSQRSTRHGREKATVEEELVDQRHLSAVS